MTDKAEERWAVEEMEAAKEEALRAAQDWHRRLDEAEGRVDELWIERERAVSSMGQISNKGWSAIVRAGLGERPLFPRSEQTLENLVSSFRSIASKLEDLPEAVKDLVAQEGQDLAGAVAEHVLACYHSRDPEFSLEPARLGVDESRGEAVREVAKEIAEGFTREAADPDEDDDQE